MARDHGLEEMLREDLAGREGLTERPMFGGLAFLLRGHLLCGARADGMMARLGKGNDAWALALPGAAALDAGGRRLPGWVRVPPELCADDGLRRRLLDAALGVVAGLPPK